MRRALLPVLCLAAGLAAVALAEGRGPVASTLHNLSSSGPGRIRAAKEDEICIFCHASHSARGARALWNRDATGESFLVRRAGDAFAVGGGQPDGASRLCLSCHDGTLALGAFGGRKVEMVGTAAGRMPPGSRGNLGRDLSGSHPISFRLSPEAIARANAEGAHLASFERIRSDPDLKLDGQQKMQCTTCHDPHDDRNFASSGVHFFRKPDFSEACLVCHAL